MRLESMQRGIARRGALVVVMVGVALAASGAFDGPTIAWAQQGGHAGGHHQPSGDQPAGGPHHRAGPTQDHHRAVEACLAEFEKVVGEGRGFGMAFAADQNGYPGPMHVLELKDRLKLTADQEARVQSLMTAMFAESRPKSARLLEAEARLRRLFADGAADEATVRAAVQAVEQARGEVRLVHLLTHLRTREILSEEQRRIYHEARWGGR